jgi:hypothetical protein
MVANGDYPVRGQESATENRPSRVEAFCLDTG